MDLTTLTEEELDALRVEILVEQERRRDIEAIPAEIERLSARFYRASRLEEPPVEAATHGIKTAKAARIKE